MPQALPVRSTLRQVHLILRLSHIAGNRQLNATHIRRHRGPRQASSRPVANPILIRQHNASTNAALRLLRLPLIRRLSRAHTRPRRRRQTSNTLSLLRQTRQIIIQQRPKRHMPRHTVSVHGDRHLLDAHPLAPIGPLDPHPIALLIMLPRKQQGGRLHPFSLHGLLRVRTRLQSPLSHDLRSLLLLHTTSRDRLLHAAQVSGRLRIVEVPYLVALTGHEDVGAHVLPRLRLTGSHGARQTPHQVVPRPS